jgi:riboflavin kinase/FMN adenylyltransferase
VHLGHQAVIAEARAVAQASGAPFAVLTFEPHPRSVFQPGAAPFRLTPFRSKAHLLASLGVDHLFILRFDTEFARRSAEDFVDHVLVDGLGAAHVVVGYDFVFGNRRRGTPVLLRERGAALGFGVTVIEPVESARGIIYSSTRVRELLTAGKPRDAAAVLGHFWEIEGRVERGDRLGRTIGFPTANLSLGPYLRPAIGIYAARAGLAEGDRTRWYDAASYVGWRPTVGGTDLRLETFLLDFDGDLYGRQLRVALVEHLRGDEKLDGMEALKAQIAEDCRRAREALVSVGKETFSSPSSG